VWDDRGADGDFRATDGNAHQTASVLDLVDGYRKHGIPIGAVILDSPWSTNYNTFRFDPRRYADPAGLIQALHQRNVRVVAWLTAAMNPASAAFSDDGDYQQAVRNRYLLFEPDGSGIHWWKGEGGLLNFADPRAVRWWHGLMDRTLDLGIDGWKVDKVEASLPDEVDEQDRREPIREAAYRKAYFRDTYRYLLRRRPEGVVLQRPFYRDTVAYTPAGWVGDQAHTWKGLRSAVRLVMGGARCGNAVVGSDIGGYLGGSRPNKALYLRWTQFGALCPLMETGGQTERRPWMIDEETTRVYRRYARLHAELAPYLYSRMVEAHNTGVPIIRAGRATTGEYRLGDDLFVSLVFGPGITKDVHLPPGEWIDWWDESRVFRGPALLKGYPAPLDRLPLFVRRGALLPLDAAYEADAPNDSGALTLAAYPAAGDTGSLICDYAYETGPLRYATAQLQVTVTAAGPTLSAPPLPQPVRVQVHLTGRPLVALVPSTHRG
jgi:alpha-glucosidase (family GH31 glycosyl hydrolase)